MAKGPRLFLVSLLLCSLSLDAAAQTRKLSADYAGAPSGAVIGAKLSPDGAHVVFLGRPTTPSNFGPNAFTPNELQLWSTASVGRTPVELCPLRIRSSPDPVALFQVTPDSGAVVFVMDAELDLRAALFRAPIDGSAAPVPLQPPPVPGGGVRSFGFAGSDTVVYSSDALADEVFELFRAPLDGSAPPTRLNDPIGGSRDVDGYAIAADGSRVAFVVDRSQNQGHDLFSALADGSAAPTLLSGTLPVPTYVGGLQVTPDSTRVLFTDNHSQLHTVPLDGSAPPVLLSTALQVTAFQPSPDGVRVVFVAYASAVRNVYSAPSDGSAPAVQLSTGGSSTFAVTPDSTGVVYASGVGELFRTPIAAAAPQSLTAPLRATRFGFDPSGAHVVFAGTTLGGGPARLYSVPADGSAPPADLSGAIAPSGSLDTLQAFTPDGTMLVYSADQDAAGRHDLFAVPVAGGALARRLALGSALPSPVLLATDAAALFLGDLEWPTVTELFQVPLDASAAPSNVSHLPLNVPQGDFRELALSPDERWAVYRGDPDELGRFELFSVPADGRGPQRRLSPPLLAGRDVLPGFAIDPTSSFVVYLADQDADEVFELYRVPLDGSSGAVKLSVPLVSGGDVESFLISPLGTFVAYRADAGLDEEFRLYSTRMDGAFPVLLTPALTTGGDVLPDYRWSDDLHAVYHADQDVDEQFELYLADGQGNTPRLNATLVGGGDVVAFALGGSGLVYLADQDVDEQFELFARTGLAAPIQISAEPLTPFGDVQADLRVTPDGRFAFYRADGAVDEAFDLFRAPLDGTSPPVRFNAALTGGQDVVEFQLGPDGERVVYRSNQPASARFELHSRPVDASSASVWISGSNGNVFDFVISPTSDRVAFRAGGDYQVFLVPLDGSALPVPVPFNNPFLRSHVAYAFSSNGRRLLALDLGDQALRMLDVRAPEQVKILDAGPLPAEGAIFVPGRSQVFFLAAHDTPGAVELFACPYGKVVGASRGQ